MKTLLLIQIGLLCLFTNKIFSQAWEHTYGGGSRDAVEWGRSITVDNSGNVYVAGQSNANYLVLKLDISGTQLWANTYNGSGNGSDLAKKIVVDGSGNVYVTGYAVTTNGTDIVTIKYNSSGTQQWVAIHDESGLEDVGNFLVVDGSGNVYVTGITEDTNHWGSYHIITIKYNSSGTQQWVDVIVNDGPDESNAICLDNSSNVYIAGSLFDDTTNTDIVIVKYNTSGVKQWTSTWDGGTNGSITYGEKITAMAISDSNYVYITGTSGGVSISGFDYNYVTQKYNSSGSLQWTSQYNGPATNSGNFSNDIALTTDGYVCITGLSMNTNGDNDYATIKYNAAGSEQWVSRYNGPGNGDDDAVAIAIDEGGCIFVTGGSLGSGTNIDYATLKYTSGGSQLSVERLNGSASNYDISLDIAVYSNPDFEVSYYFVTGSEKNTDEDCTTLGYTYIGCSSEEEGDNIVNIPVSNKLMQNYPNPFNPVTQIKFNIRTNSFVSLKIYDLLGREVKTLLNENLSAGRHNIVWDATNYPSGIYVYELLANDYIETKKMVLIK